MVLIANFKIDKKCGVAYVGKLRIGGKKDSHIKISLKKISDNFLPRKKFAHEQQAHAACKAVSLASGSFLAV